MRLGELIDTLEGFNPELPVRFSDGRFPTMFSSWRGIYAELTLHPGWEHAGAVKQITVGQLLNRAKKANGATFEGYKGGDYTMSRDTPVWADEYGDCGYDAITGVVISGDEVVLQVTNIGDYR